MSLLILDSINHVFVKRCTQVIGKKRREKESEKSLTFTKDSIHLYWVRDAHFKMKNAIIWKTAWNRIHNNKTQSVLFFLSYFPSLSMNQMKFSLDLIFKLLNDMISIWFFSAPETSWSRSRFTLCWRHHCSTYNDNTITGGRHHVYRITKQTFTTFGCSKFIAT